MREGGGDTVTGWGTEADCMQLLQFTARGPAQPIHPPLRTTRLHDKLLMRAPLTESSKTSMAESARVREHVKGKPTLSGPFLKNLISSIHRKSTRGEWKSKKRAM